MRIVSISAALIFACGFAAFTQEPAPPWRTGVISPRIASLEKQVASGEKSAEARFWSDIKTNGSPLVEPVPGDPGHVLVTFLFKADKPVTGVLLDAQLAVTREDPPNALTHLANTDVWYKTYSMRNDMRFSYSLKPAPGDDSRDAGVDPLNPKTLPAGINIGRSMLELPAAPQQRGIVRGPSVPAGKIAEEQVDSKILNTQRKAWVYTPAVYDARRAAAYPVMICFDGTIYGADDAVAVPAILDNLIAAGEIAPMIAIFVAQSAQPQRNIELSNNAPFADFIAQELLPQLRRKWLITNNPAETVACGSSAGGLAALFLAFHRPDVVGNVLAQSAALWPGAQRDNPEHEWLTRQFESSKRLRIRIVLQPGMLEVVQTPLAGPSILRSNRHLRDVLTAKGYEVHYSEVAGGHEPLAWRGGIAPGLIQLLGRNH